MLCCVVLCCVVLCCVVLCCVLLWFGLVWFCHALFLIKDLFRVHETIFKQTIIKFTIRAHRLAGLLYSRQFSHVPLAMKEASSVS